MTELTIVGTLDFGSIDKESYHLIGLEFCIRRMPYFTLDCV
jgi:hypothetical protein